MHVIQVTGWVSSHDTNSAVVVCVRVLCTGRQANHLAVGCTAHVFACHCLDAPQDMENFNLYVALTAACLMLR